MIVSHVGAVIPTSMVAESVAGEVVNEYFDGKSSLENYELRWREKMLNIMKNAYFIKILN